MICSSQHLCISSSSMLVVLGIVWLSDVGDLMTFCVFGNDIVILDLVWRIVLLDPGNSLLIMDHMLNDMEWVTVSPRKSLKLNSLGGGGRGLFLSRALFILIIISISEKRPPSAFNVIDRLNKLVVYLYRVAFGESNKNINVTF